jgi:tRNA dimethylallyltransferase
LQRVAARRGSPALHRWLSRVDPASAGRIQPRDEKRLIRALEVYLLTGQPLTAHFAATASPIADYEVIGFVLDVPLEVLAERLARRVDEQFDGGLLAEIRDLLAAGVPPDARPFGGLVYRQAVEHLRGVRGEAETRELIARANRRYARRQLIWFRKEPNLLWLHASGHDPAAFEQASAAIGPRVRPSDRDRPEGHVEQ